MMRAKLMGISQMTISNLSANECLIPNPLYTQFVRWKRKPIWLPTAKSKLFRVPKRPVISPEEEAEITRLYNNYRTYMRSILGYIRNDHTQKELEKRIRAKIKDGVTHFEQCNKINKKWNEQVAKAREKRLEAERKARTTEILQKLLNKEARDLKILKSVEQKVRKVKEESATFITAENIEKAIEEALATVVNHDTAIDVYGTVYTGKYEKIGAEEKKIEPVDKEDIHL